MSSSSAIGDLLKGSSIILLGTVVGNFLGLLGQVLIIRSLSPVEFGEIILAFTIVSMVSTLSLLGIPEGITRLVAANDGQTSGYVSGGLSISIITGVTGALLMILFRGKLASLMEEPSLTSLLLILAVYVVFSSLASACVGALRGYQLYAAAVLSERILSKLVTIALFLVTSYLGMEYLGAVLYWLIAPFLIVILSIYALIIKSNFQIPEYKMIKEQTSELVSFSWPLAFESGFVLLMSKLDVVFLGLLATSSSVGLYRSVQPISTSLLMILTAIVFVYLPIATRSYADEDIETLKNLYNVSTKWIVHLTLPPILLLILFSDEIISILYGNSYTPAAIALSILALSALLRIYVGPNGATIKAIDRTRINLISSSCGVLANVVFNVVLIPEYGITGAAIATMIGYAIYNSIEVTVIYLEVGIHPFSKESTVPALVTLLVVGVLSYIFNSSPGGMVVIAASGVTIALLHLLIIYLTGGIQEEDMILIHATEDKIGESIITKRLKLIIRSRTNQ